MVKAKKNESVLAYSWSRRCEYDYDTAGNIAAIYCADSSDASPNVVARYTYDGRNRLSAVVWLNNDTVERSVAYAYDGDESIEEILIRTYEGGYHRASNRYDGKMHLVYQVVGDIPSPDDTTMTWSSTYWFRNNRYGDPVSVVGDVWKRGRDTVEYQYRYDQYGNWVERKKLRRNRNTSPIRKSTGRAMEVDIRKIKYHPVQRKSPKHYRE